MVTEATYPDPDPFRTLRKRFPSLNAKRQAISTIPAKLAADSQA
jgi:hypothetical protein